MRCRCNHYEAAFIAYAHSRGATVVPLDELVCRPPADRPPCKTPDCLVLRPGLAQTARLVVDIKGRRFGGTAANPRRHWPSWCTAADVAALLQWAEGLGEGFQPVLAFVYVLAEHVELPPGTPDLFHYRGRRYLLRGVHVADYRPVMRRRSPRWDTVDVPAEVFRRIVRPFAEFLLAPAAADPPTAIHDRTSRRTTSYEVTTSLRTPLDETTGRRCPSPSSSFSRPH